MKKAMSLANTLIAAVLLAGCGSKAISTSNQYCHAEKEDTSGAGRKAVLICDGNRVLASSEAQALLLPNISVSFVRGGKVIKAGDITRQSANRVGKSDEDTCVRAFINAAHKFQSNAEKLGGSKVTNFYSYYDRKPMKNGQYACEVGTFHGRVVMKGDVAK